MFKDSLSNLPSPFGPPTHWDRILHITPSQSPIRLASTDSPYENSVGILSDLSIGEAAHLEEINQQVNLFNLFLLSQMAALYIIIFLLSYSIR